MHVYSYTRFVFGLPYSNFVLDGVSADEWHEALSSITMQFSGEIYGRKYRIKPEFSGDAASGETVFGFVLLCTSPDCDCQPPFKLKESMTPLGLLAGMKPIIDMFAEQWKSIRVNGFDFQSCGTPDVFIVPCFEY